MKERERQLEKNIAVLGTGAIGSSIGADLTKAGYNVLLVDQWPAHVEAMKASGLHGTMAGEEFQIQVQACHLCDLSSLKPRFDMVFLACKSYDTCWMVELIKPYLKADGVLISTQNSINDEWIAPIIGRERDIACAFELSAEVFEPGLVKRNTDHNTTQFILGELDGRITSRVEEVAQILGTVGKTEVSTNIWGAKWTKLVLNSMTMALCGVLGIRSWQVAENADYLTIAIKLGKEAAMVGTSLGFTLVPIFGLSAQDFSKLKEEELKSLYLRVVRVRGKGYITALLQDLLKKRRTEAGYLNGLVVKKGLEVNVPTPVNEAVTALVHKIEEGTLEMGTSNFEMLKHQL